MDYVDDKSALTVPQDGSKLFGRPAEYIGSRDASTVEQIVAFREFFELLAEWDHEESDYGN
jgi:hypothetical protein